LDRQTQSSQVMEIIKSQSSVNLSSIMSEFGYSCCANKQTLLELLNHPEIKKELNEEQIAKVLIMMSKSHM